MISTFKFSCTLLSLSSPLFPSFSLTLLSQIRSQSESMNANEIANGVLSALVAITSSCPFVEYWGACMIGGKVHLC